MTIALNNTDVIEGGASVAGVVDYTVNGIVGTTITALASGSLTTTLTTALYTAGAAVGISSIVLVNTHSAAVDVTIRRDPTDGGSPQYLIPKTVSLGAGYSLHTNGAVFSVHDTSGNTIVTYPANISCTTVTTTGNITVGGALIVPDGGYIRSVSDADSLQIAADGKITLTQDLTLNEDLIVGDGKYIGPLSAPDSSQYEADGDVFFKYKVGVGATPTQKLTVTVADNDNVQGIYVDQNDVTNNPIAVQIDNAGESGSLYIYQQGVLASSCYGLYVYSNAAQTDGNSRLVYIRNDNAGSIHAAMEIENDGTGYCLYLDQNGNGIPLFVDNAGTNVGLEIYQSGVLASSCYGLYVYSNAAQINSPLALFFMDNASSDKNVVQITNDGVGAGIYVAQNGGAYALSLYGNYASNYVAKIQNDGNNANRYGVLIQAGADDASGVTIYINCLDGNGDQVGYIENNGTTFQLVDGSDERLKGNILPTSIVGLDIINKIEVIDHGYIKSGEYCQASFTAQQLLTAFAPAVSGRPGETEEYEAERERGNIVKHTRNEKGDIVATEVVEEDVDIRDYRRNKREIGEWVKTKNAVMGVRDKMMGVSRDRLVPVIVKGVQELTVMVNNNINDVSVLKQRIEDLEEEIEQLKKAA